MSDQIVITVTLNPSIDAPIALDELHLGGTNRCLSSRLEPGGKGINASRVIRRLRGETMACGLAGGATGALLRQCLNDELVPHAFEQTESQTRLDVMIYERGVGRRTRLLEAGAPVTEHEIEALRYRLRKLAPGRVVILGGSLPPGVSPATYQDFVAALNACDARCIVDASGEALVQVLAAHPALIKPNEEEASQVIGRSIASDEDVVDAAYELQRRGARSVVISRAEKGAIGVDELGGAWKIGVPQVVVRSTIGAGDSMVGGIALALSRGESFAQALALGAAAGTASVAAADRELCRLQEVETLLPRVSVKSITPRMRVEA